MQGTNPDPESETDQKPDQDAPVADNDIIEEDLAKLKKESEVESSAEETDEPETEEPQDDQEEAETSEEEPKPSDDEDSLVKLKQEFPNIKGDTLEEFSANLAVAYQNSTKEALRLKGLTDKQKPAESEGSDNSEGPVDPRLLYVERIVNDDIAKAYQEFRKDFPQVDDADNYEKFVAEVADLSSYYHEKKNTVLTAQELYPRAAANLGWAKQVADSKDKLDAALKDSAANSKTTSTSKKAPKSKVTDAEVQIARRTWATGKSDSEIRAELEQFHT